MKSVLLIFALSLLMIGSLAAQHQEHTSEYVGQEHREIKSLSDNDIVQLKAGQGWGLAKAAELNGVPGPSHILDMKSEISLSDEQVKQIEVIFGEMQKQAIKFGEQLIQKEKKLNNAFAEGTINRSELQALTKEIGLIRGELTFVHLSAHLKAAEILTTEQIDQYNKLRGYDLIKDPCKEVPEGHDHEMWKLHNNCND